MCARLGARSPPSDVLMCLAVCASWACFQADLLALSATYCVSTFDLSRAAPWMHPCAKVPFTSSGKTCKYSRPLQITLILPDGANAAQCSSPGVPGHASAYFHKRGMQPSFLYFERTLCMSGQSSMISDLPTRTPWSRHVLKFHQPHQHET